MAITCDISPPSAAGGHADALPRYKKERIFAANLAIQTASLNLCCAFFTVNTDNA